MVNLTEFKKDLKAVLEKHSVYLSVEASGCSDWHGISDQRFSVIDEKTGKEHRLADYQSYVDARDLEV